MKYSEKKPDKPYKWYVLTHKIPGTVKTICLNCEKKVANKHLIHNTSLVLLHTSPISINIYCFIVLEIQKGEAHWIIHQSEQYRKNLLSSKKLQKCQHS